MPPFPEVSSAVIIAVGSELLTPHRTDTNSLFLAGALNDLGIELRYKTVVGDSRDDLAAALRHAIPRSDVVVTTGGLGPTDDDVTRDTIAEVLARPLEEDPAITASIRERFETRGLQMPEVNRRQALVPRDAEVLLNRYGTAPGLWIETEEAVCVLLPGPPRELQPMFDAVAARLVARVGGHRIARRVLRVSGLTESHTEERTQPVYSRFRNHTPVVQTSILASLGQIELHLSTRTDSERAAEEALDRATAELAAVLGRHLISSDGSRLEAVVGQLLRAQHARVAVAESCTGGLIMSRLTDVPGSSDYVEAGVVVYSNAAKTALLGVDPTLIRTHGAVSDEVAQAMAVGVRERIGADYGIGVTGIAGPGGGSPEKPVGTVCVALAPPQGAPRVRRLQLPGERERVKFQASQAALDMLRYALVR